MTPTVDRVFFYRDEEGKWRWRFRSGGNNRILADSGQGYRRLSDARESALRVTGRLPSEYPLPSAPPPEYVGYSDILAVIDREAARKPGKPRILLPRT